jgi:hypothetical protein
MQVKWKILASCWAAKGFALKLSTCKLAEFAFRDRRIRPLCHLTAPATIPGYQSHHRFYHPSTAANINGATIEASDSITNLGVSIPSFSQVIFSFGIAPEYEP